MTSPLRTLVDIALDLSRSLHAVDRYQRVVDAVRRAVPCDAAALLRVEGAELKPLAAFGLVPETLGRVFRREDHPRLEVICRADGPVHFPEDSALPDPFDGLIEGDHHALDHVHSCLGCPLRVDGELVGVLTADALEPGAFRTIDQEQLTLLSALAGATLRTTVLLELAVDLARHQGSVARALMSEKLSRGGEVLGQSAPIGRLRGEIELVGPSNLGVLILGETGTGKELVAAEVHHRSTRRAAPLIHVNCAALPETLAESELFGHARGAFTGADRERPGKFEIARGGTLFLDEVGELPDSVQPKLLRALQTGEIQRVGSDRPLRTDVRIVAATNRDLAKAVASGHFRADLYHRLHGFPLRVPALRERLGDLPLLAGHFADRARMQLGTGPVRFTDDARQALQAADWPGNVRELENVVARVVLRAAHGRERGRPVTLTAESLAPELRKTLRTTSSPAAKNARKLSLPEQLDAYKRDLIAAALDSASGNWSKAARDLGVERSNLRITAKRLGLG